MKPSRADLLTFQSQPEILHSETDYLAARIKAMGFAEGEYAVVGGAAMAFHGLRYHDRTVRGDGNDPIIEVLVTKEHFNGLFVDWHLDEIDWLGEVGCGLKLIEPTTGQKFNLIDAESFRIPGLDASEIIHQAVDRDGVSVIDMDNLYLWKKATGERIDRSDIRLIKEYRTRRFIADVVGRVLGRK
jgi:hypothetical protein